MRPAGLRRGVTRGGGVAVLAVVRLNRRGRHSLVDHLAQGDAVGTVEGWMSPGTRLTDRDHEILAWIGRHGIVTPQQVGRRFFTSTGAVAQKRAYRRLAKLEDLGLIRRDNPFARHPGVLRLSSAGAATVGSELGPARFVPREVPHLLAVVDLVEGLVSANKGAQLRTGREIRSARRRERTEGQRDVGRGRAPDAELTLKSGETVAIEVDLIPRRLREYRVILTGYQQERFTKVWWYVPGGDVARVRALVVDSRCDDFVDVREAPGTRVAHPEVTDLEIEILTWIGRHGVVTAHQVAKHFFSRDDGSVGIHATSNRLRKLEALRYVDRRISAAGQASVFRLTETGTDVTDGAIRPAGWVPGELEHSLALVDLLEGLVTEHPGATYRTEREIRTDRGRKERGRSTAADGRVPDGELLLPSGKVVALELDLTAKRSRDVEIVVHNYTRSAYDAVWWFVRPASVGRMEEAVRAQSATRLVDVHPWGSR